MKRTTILFIYVLSLLLSAGAFAQTPLTVEERKKALDHLKDSQKELLKTVKGLSAEQLNFKISADSWSVAECVEHIAVSESNLFGIVNMTLQAQPDPSQRSEVKMSDDQIIGLITSREQKVKTKPDLEPSDRFQGFEASLNEFKEKRKANLEFVKSTKEDLRNRYFDFPFGKVDAYQVILFLSGHSVRHTDQIKEILAHESFPAS